MRLFKNKYLRRDFFKEVFGLELFPKINFILLKKLYLIHFSFFFINAARVGFYKYNIENLFYQSLQILYTKICVSHERKLGIAVKVFHKRKVNEKSVLCRETCYKCKLTNTVKMVIHVFQDFHVFFFCKHT